MTAKQLTAWLQSLPPEFQDAEIEAVVGPFPASAKRVVAYRYKGQDDHDHNGSRGRGIYVNPMGTHVSDEFLKDIEIRSVLTSDGKVFLIDAGQATPPESVEVRRES